MSNEKPPPATPIADAPRRAEPRATATVGQDKNEPSVVVAPELLALPPERPFVARDPRRVAPTMPEERRVAELLPPDDVEAPPKPTITLRVRAPKKPRTGAILVVASCILGAGTVLAVVLARPAGGSAQRAASVAISTSTSTSTSTPTSIASPEPDVAASATDTPQPSVSPRPFKPRPRRPRPNAYDPSGI